jgi:hypothetical protein
VCVILELALRIDPSIGVTGSCCMRPMDPGDKPDKPRDDSCWGQDSSLVLVAKKATDMDVRGQNGATW